MVKREEETVTSECHNRSRITDHRKREKTERQRRQKDREERERLDKEMKRLKEGKREKERESLGVWVGKNREKKRGPLYSNPRGGPPSKKYRETERKLDLKEGVRERETKIS